MVWSFARDNPNVHALAIIIAIISSLKLIEEHGNRLHHLEEDVSQ